MSREPETLRQALCGLEVPVVMFATAAITLYGLGGTIAGFNFSWAPSAAALYILAGAIAMVLSIVAEKRKSGVAVVSLTLLFLNAFVYMFAFSTFGDYVLVAGWSLGFVGLGDMFAMIGLCFWASGNVGQKISSSRLEQWRLIDVAILFFAFAGVWVMARASSFVLPEITTYIGAVAVFASMIYDRVRPASEDASCSEFKWDFEHAMSVANPPLLTALVALGMSVLIGGVTFMLWGDDLVSSGVPAILTVLAIVNGIGQFTFLMANGKLRAYQIADVVLSILGIVAVAFMSVATLPISAFAYALVPTTLLVAYVVTHAVYAGVTSAGNVSSSVVREKRREASPFAKKGRGATQVRTAEELDRIVEKAVAKSEKLGAWSGNGAFSAQEKKINEQWDKAVAQRSVIECLTSDRFGATGLTKATFLDKVDKVIASVKDNCIAAGRYSTGFSSPESCRNAVKDASADIDRIIEMNDVMLSSLDNLIARFRRDEMNAMFTTGEEAVGEIADMIDAMDKYAA